MKIFMWILIVILMMIKVAPAFSQSSGIWSNEGLPTGYGSQNAPAEDFSADNDWDNQFAVGELPIQDGSGVMVVASLLYGIYLVRKHNRKNASL
ncbi:hypothetical protein FACS189451_05910 [Bacteroidia bacterium]|nr:hypothetical protein FACS189446_7510 [Bacteroidia bacterium]GHT62178.1 hypothetical protein FACS189451_05910 [Bacteroidia bacterium]GHU79204.1 hypothetical protein FACS1894145_2850 [Bacteroidia bacterium]